LTVPHSEKKDKTSLLLVLHNC